MLSSLQSNTTPITSPACHNFFRRFGLLTLLFLLPSINLHLLGFRQNYLYQYINLNSQFSFLNALWLIIFVAIFAYLSANLGQMLAQKINLNLPLSFQTAIGVMVINIYLLPFFFFNLFKFPIIIFIFLPPSYQDLDIDFCPATIRKCFYYQKNQPQDCFEI